MFAIGDIVRPGLLTQAIGAGRDAARAILEIFEGKRPCEDTRTMFDYKRATLEYFDPRIMEFDDLDNCASQCSSCGACRDCGLCETLCPVGAISRKQLAGTEFEMVSDPNKCIGCGFCANACPCGVWELHPEHADGIIRRIIRKKKPPLGVAFFCCRKIQKLIY